MNNTIPLVDLSDPASQYLGLVLALAIVLYMVRIAKTKRDLPQRWPMPCREFCDDFYDERWCVRCGWTKSAHAERELL